MASHQKPRREMVGVFKDEQAARRAAEAARRAGASPSDIRVGAPGDDVAALQGEMREEAEHTFLGPGSVGPFTKEMSKGIAISVPVGCVLGAVLGMALGLLPFAGLSLGARLVIGCLVGVVAGATIGFVVGGGFGAKGPAEPLAAERGVTVHVASDDPKVGAALAGEDPIRVDVVRPEGSAVDTVTTEEERQREEGGHRR